MLCSQSDSSIDLREYLFHWTYGTPGDVNDRQSTPENRERWRRDEGNRSRCEVKRSIILLVCWRLYWFLHTVPSNTSYTEWVYVSSFLFTPVLPLSASGYVACNITASLCFSFPTSQHKPKHIFTIVQCITLAQHHWAIYNTTRHTTTLNTTPHLITPQHHHTTPLYTTLQQYTTSPLHYYTINVAYPCRQFN